MKFYIHKLRHEKKSNLIFFNQLKSDCKLHSSRYSTSDVNEVSKDPTISTLNQALKVLYSNTALESLGQWSLVLVVTSEISIVLATRSLQVEDFLWFIPCGE